MILLIVILAIVLAGISIAAVSGMSAAAVSGNAAQIADAIAIAELGKGVQAQANATIAVANASTHNLIISLIAVALVALVALVAGIAVGDYLRRREEPQTSQNPNPIRAFSEPPRIPSGIIIEPIELDEPIRADWHLIQHTERRK